MSAGGAGPFLGQFRSALLEIECIDRAAVNEPCHTGVERSLCGIARTLDIDPMHDPTRVADDRDDRSDVEHVVGARECLGERRRVEDIDVGVLDPESGERLCLDSVCSADFVAPVEERAHEVRADETIGTGDDGQHVRILRRPRAGGSGSDPALTARLVAVRGLVQRVTRASVVVDGQTVGEIGSGLCVLVGVTHDDGPDQVRKLADKIWNLRIMADDEGAMNLSIADTTRGVLIVSQFTLYGDTRKGRRPSWIDAARPEVAEPLVEAVVEELRGLGAEVATGIFGADMALELVNDGPVTLLLDV